MSAWPTHPISELGRITTGSTPSTSEEDLYGGETPFVTPAELDQTDPVVTAARTLSPLGIAKARLLPPDTVMVCCIGSLGKVGISGRTVATNQQINSVEFDQTRVWPRYGFYACRLLKPRLEMMAPATTVAIVNKSKFEKLEIPVPPLPEQRRIAEILDKADALRAKRRAALAQLDTLTQSIFLDMFGDPATNPKGWASETIGEVADQVTDGEHLTPRRATEGIKLLSARNIRDGYLDFDNVDYIDADEYERISRRCDPSAGDVLISCSGTIGRVASVETTEKFSLVRSAALIRPNRDRIGHKFLEHYLRSPAMKARMLRRANASSQANLFQGQIRELPVYLPPLRLQREFADRVAFTGSLRDCESASLVELDALFASLQHRAFRGEL